MLHLDEKLGRVPAVRSGDPELIGRREHLDHRHRRRRFVPQGGQGAHEELERER
jgi:hypothetical protein